MDMLRPMPWLAPCLACFFTLSTLASCDDASAPVSGTDQAQTGADTPLEKFNAEMDLASKAPDRDSRVEHLKKALEFRPNDPDNIRIEWQIGIELSQRWDPKFPDQVPKPGEALVYFDRVVRNYSHMDYYEFEPHDGGMRQEFMIPEAASLAAGLEANVEKAREYSLIAMDRLYETYAKRLEDWRNEPYPEVISDPEADPFHKSRARYADWQQRQKKAAQGDVFTGQAKTITRVAVERFRSTFHPKNAEETRTALQVVQQRYPYSPLSKAAGELIREAEKAEQEAAANTE